MRRFTFIGLFSIVTAGVLAFVFVSTMKQEVFVVPEGYEGCVLVVYNVPDGQELKHSGFGQKTFKIPADGILETVTMPSYGTKRVPKFFSRDSSGQLHELSYVSPGDWGEFQNKAEIVVSTLEFGEDYKPWKSFIVGSVGDQQLCADRQLFVREYLNKFRP